MIVAALLLSACSGVNAGSASKQDLERAFAEDPAIESMDLRVANDLPWVGGVSGDIIAKEGSTRSIFARSSNDSRSSVRATRAAAFRSV